MICKVQCRNKVIKGLKSSINILCTTLAHVQSSRPVGFVLDKMSRSSVQSGLVLADIVYGVCWLCNVVDFSKCYTCDCVLLSPSSQYSSDCISVRRDTVLWKANLSSSPLKMDRLLASSC